MTGYDRFHVSKMSSKTRQGYLSIFKNILKHRNFLAVVLCSR